MLSMKLETDMPHGLVLCVSFLVFLSHSPSINDSSFGSPILLVVVLQASKVKVGGAFGLDIDANPWLTAESLASVR